MPALHAVASFIAGLRVPFLSAKKGVSALFAPNCTAVMGAMLAAFTTRPVYMNRGVNWMGLASCRAFFTATVGCVLNTSTIPLMPPIPVCSQKLNSLLFVAIFALMRARSLSPVPCPLNSVASVSRI